MLLSFFPFFCGTFLTLSLTRTHTEFLLHMRLFAGSVAPRARRWRVEGSPGLVRRTASRAEAGRWWPSALVSHCDYSSSGHGTALRTASAHCSSTSVFSTSGSGASGESSTGKGMQYFNFKTSVSAVSDLSGDAKDKTRRTRRLSSRVGELPHLHVPYVPSPSDPYAKVRIFRKDFIDINSSKAALSAYELSVDQTARTFLDMFCDYEGRRCKLCNEVFSAWHLHCAGIPHSGREAMLLELVRPYCGTPEEILKMWWYRLNTWPAFHRIPSLSHDNQQVRKARLLYLLRLLKDRGVLIETFGMSDGLGSSSRSYEFERLEFFGDNTAKCVLNDVIAVVFPVHEGGTRGKLPLFQFVMDGNDGLARGYDHLGFEALTGGSRLVSKFKSDVVETLFAELQMYLWSTQRDISTAPVVFPFTREMYALRAIVQHVMYEAAIELFLFHIGQVLGALQRIMRENQVQFLLADPALKPVGGAAGRTAAAAPLRHGGWGGGDDRDEYGGRSRSSGGLTGGVVPPSLTLMRARTPHRQQHDSGAALYFESSNYDKFKQVVRLGGLLPRAFPREALSVIPNFMPHLQCDAATSGKLLRAGGPDWAALASTVASAEEGEDRAHDASTDGAPFALHRRPEPRPQADVDTASFSVARLKDEQLVAELL